MNNIKLYEKNLKKRVGALALSIALGATSFGITGCVNDKQNDSKNNIKYTVEEGNNRPEYIINYSSSLLSRAKSNDDAVYENYVNLSNLAIDDINDLENDIDYVYPTRSLKLSNSIKDSFGMEYAAFPTGVFKWSRDKIVPDSYRWAENYFGEEFNNNLSTIKFSIDELKSNNDNYYVNCDLNITFDKDIDIPNGIKYLDNNNFYETYGMQKPIKKGDKLNYKALYLLDYDENGNKKLILIADEQTGIGSDCDNIKNNVKHNYNDVFKSLSSIEIESKTFSNEEEFEEYLDNSKSRQR